MVQIGSDRFIINTWIEIVQKYEAHSYFTWVKINPNRYKLQTAIDQLQQWGMISLNMGVI